MKALKDKLCPTCLYRKPEVSKKWNSTQAHSTPVTDCKTGSDINDCGVCDEYRNLWTGRNGIYGKPPDGRPLI